MAGRNRALRSVGTESFKFTNMLESVNENKPCIFLSHISVDKKSVEGIAKYIMEKADIDVYLDIHDDELQRAVNIGDSVKITALIERGIDNSTHAMCLISDKTINSWWVPYELGYAKKSEKEISSLKLKGAVELPDFLKIGKLINGTKSLNEYIQKVIINFETNESNLSLDVALESYAKANHPLNNILDCDK